MHPLMQLKPSKFEAVVRHKEHFDRGQRWHQKQVLRFQRIYYGNGTMCKYRQSYHNISFRSQHQSSFLSAFPNLPICVCLCVLRFGNFYRFGKSNAMYMTWLVAGILAVELIHGKATDYIWASVNRGRTYDTVDWSKFKSLDDEEEEEGWYCIICIISNFGFSVTVFCITFFCRVCTLLFHHKKKKKRAKLTKKKKAKMKRNRIWN